MKAVQVNYFTVVGSLLAVCLLTAGCATPTSSPRASRGASFASSQSSKPVGVEEAEVAAPPTDAAGAKAIDAQAHYGAAVFYELSQRESEALDEFRKAALDDPAHEPLVTEVAKRLLLARRPEQALEVLVRATALPDASPNLYAWLGLTYAQLDKPDLAIRADRTALRKSPLLIQGYQNLVLLYLRQGKVKEAAKIFDEALRQPSPNAAFLINLADLFVNVRPQLGQEAEGFTPRFLAALDRASVEKPDSTTLIQKLGDSYVGLGESAKAISIYRELLAKDPESGGIREKLVDLYVRNNDSKHAREQLEAIIHDNPANSQAYYVLGTLAADDNDLKKAEESFRRVLLFNPNFEPGYYDLARVLLMQEEPQKALAILSKVRARSPQSFLLEYYTGCAYNELKDFSEAIKSFTAAEVIAAIGETNRPTHLLYFQLGAAYERNKDYTLAEKSFQKCLALAPDFAEALNYLGYMWAERGVNLEQARSLIEKAVKLSPDNAAYVDSLGWVLFKLHQPNEALRQVQKAVALAAKPDATLFDHLGDIYAALKQPQKAEEAWRKSLQIEPNDQVKKKLDRQAVQTISTP